MSLSTLQELFVEELKDLYDAEHQIVAALPKLIKAASSPDLKQAFEQHLSLTEGHIERLDEVFAARGCKPQRKACDGMKGLLAEGAKVLEEKMTPEVRDAALVAAAQRVEHYEMAGYGTAAAIARKLGHDDVAELLEATLEEEKATDAKLTELAESAVNAEAGAAGEDAA
jgi:ferritin-like metal-binding protein YciE